MTTPIWISCLAALALAAAIVPLLVPSVRERGYPLEGNVLVGTAVVALGLCAPATLAPYWIEAMVALGVTAMIPLGVDAWIDRKTGGERVPGAPMGAGDDDGGASAAMAASAAALSAASCALSAATIVSITN